MKTVSYLFVVLTPITLLLCGGGCARQGGEEQAKAAKGSVVVYTALDRQFSEPIFERFTAETGIEVLPKYDTESTKTVGLVNALRAEKDRPRCDVFWNNEIVNTMRLKEEGILGQIDPTTLQDWPATFRDPENQWVGFAARARVLLVNTDLVPDGQEPATLTDLTTAAWKGKVGIAKPLFGTTATHAACLFTYWGDAKARQFFLDLLANDVQVLAGNAQCAKAVGEGQLPVALTDTDDAMGMIESGAPVKIVYLDDEPDQMGTLFIPNTLAVIAGGPNPEQAQALIRYLLDPAVEAALAQGPSAQIPVNPQVTVSAPVKGPKDIKAMDVDFFKAAQAFESTAAFIQDQFLR